MHMLLMVATSPQTARHSPLLILQTALLSGMRSAHGNGIELSLGLSNAPALAVQAHTLQ